MDNFIVYCKLLVTEENNAKEIFRNGEQEKNDDDEKEYGVIYYEKRNDIDNLLSNIELPRIDKLKKS